jgi:2-octaprenyl-6-methoxyphenol hydroxylase
MTDEADILIVGGGLNGPTLALALAQGGLRVMVIDALAEAERAASGFDGRAYALALASVRLLRALGLWDELAPRAQPILEVKACDGRAGEGPSPLFLHLHHAELEEGPMGQMIEDRHLRRALLAAMEAEPRITHLAGERVVAQEALGAGARLELASGRGLTGRLLVGCDGRTSGTAARAGIRRVGWSYGQTALVCAIAHAQPHHGVAHQFFMPAGPLAILPLPGDRSSIVWTERDAAAAAIEEMDDAGYLDVLRPRIGDFLGEIRLEGARFSYPLALSLAQSFIAPRLALVGDAAHGLHPIAGQGLNLGLRDVAALAEVVIEAHRRGEDIGAPLVLEAYQRWRRFDTTALALATDTFNRLFSNDSTVLRGLRDLGMAAVSRSPGLRRRVMREAAGLSGDMPRLLRGAPI